MTVIPPCLCDGNRHSCPAAKWLLVPSLFSHAGSISVDTLELDYWFHLWHGHATPELISSETNFIPFPLQTQFKALPMSLTNSCMKIFLWDSWTLSPAGPVPCKHSHDQRKQNSACGTSPQATLLTNCVFLFFSVFCADFPATKGIEENTTCVPYPSTNCPNALKCFLIVLCTSVLTSLPTFMTSYG